MPVKEKELTTRDNEVNILRKLILFNSNHFWKDVVYQLRKATGFDLEQCEQITAIAHYTGKAVVKSGEYEELKRIDDVLKEIGLITKIE